MQPATNSAEVLFGVPTTLPNFTFTFTFEKQNRWTHEFNLKTKLVTRREYASGFPSVQTLGAFLASSEPNRVLWIKQAAKRSRTKVITPTTTRVKVRIPGPPKPNSSKWMTELYAGFMTRTVDPDIFANGMTVFLSKLHDGGLKAEIETFLMLNAEDLADGSFGPKSKFVGNLTQSWLEYREANGILDPIRSTLQLEPGQPLDSYQYVAPDHSVPYKPKKGLAELKFAANKATIGQRFTEFVANPSDESKAKLLVVVGKFAEGKVAEEVCEFDETAETYQDFAQDIVIEVSRSIPKFVPNREGANYTKRCRLILRVAYRDL